jgi:hypothetical protein
MTVVTELLKNTWQAMNPREPKPTYLLTFFLCAMVVFGLGLLIGQTT